MTDPRRNLPGVDVLLASQALRSLLEEHPRGRLVEAVRDALDSVRAQVVREGEGAVPPDDDAWAGRVRELLLAKAEPSLRGVINATGVILHTNLGRAPLSEATRLAMTRAGRGYSNLEFELDAGERGSRYVHCVELLKEITGAQDALVVNNNAAAVVLGLNTMAAGGDVLVSRGELVEIGGGFRIPDMISRSGATLREVGTTNRTRAEDYREAAGEGTVKAILKVHRSNFRISGFTEEASMADLVTLARELGIPLFHDLGSGLLAEPNRLGLPPEPRAFDSLRSGAHAVAVSGDKLLGGPQAGILLGEEKVMDAMRKNPLCRAFRVDKVTLAGLEATLRHYLDPEEALREIPVLRMLSQPQEDLERRAQAMASGLEEAQRGVPARVSRGSGVVGGGTFPGVELPGWTVRIRAANPGDLARRLRAQDPPVITRVEGEEVVLDPRTVDPDDDGTVLSAILSAAAAHD